MPSITKARIFGQISDLHQARMVREEREGQKKMSRGCEGLRENKGKEESPNWE